MTVQSNTRTPSLLPPALRPLAAFVLLAVTGMACGSSDPREATSTTSQALESPPWEEIPDPDPTPTAPFGRIDAKAGVDSRGQFTYDVPLWVPEGRAGMAPEIGLSYNSGRGNGVLGVGWSLTGESFLHRCGKTVARDGEPDNVDFDEDDNFCLDGTKLVELEYSDDPPEFVEPPGGLGVFAEYRLERNNNSRVLAFGDQHPTAWIVLTEDLRVHYYESAVGANRYPDLEYATLGWMRNRIADRSGNEIHYDYFNPYFQLPSTKTGLRLEKIEYTVSNSGPYAGTPTREIRFIYDGERPDPISSWISGIEIANPVRLSKAEIWTPSVDGGSLSLSRSYRLAYEESGSTHRSMLSSVELCDGEPACLPKTSLRYATPPEFVTSEIGYNMTQFLLSTEHEPPNIFSHIALPDLVVIDANGDGFDDILYHDTQYSYWGGVNYLTGRPRLAFSQGLPSLDGLSFPSVVQGKPSADGGLRDGIVSWQRPIAVGVDMPASLAQHGGDGSSDGAEAAS